MTLTPAQNNPGEREISPAPALPGTLPSGACPLGTGRGPDAGDVVVTELHDAVLMLSEQRGTLRAQLAPDPEAISALDRELGAAIDQALALVPAGAPLYESIYRAAKSAHDEVRLEVVEKVLRDSALRCGLAQGRTLDQAAVDRERSLMASYRASQGDLFTHYVDLSPRVDKLLDMEEGRGIRMRLDADKIAISISISIRRFVPDAKTVIDALSKKTAHELELIKEAFEGRYQMDLATFIRRGFDRPGLNLLMPTQAIVNRAIDLLEGKKCPDDAACISHVARRAKSAFEALFPQKAELARLKDSPLLEDKAVYLKHCLEAGPKRAHGVYEVIERIGRERMPALRSKFSAALAGQNMDEAIEAMPPGYCKDRTLAFIANDSRRYNAATIGCCIERWGKDSLIAHLEEYSREGRRSLIRDFQSVYQVDFWALIEKKLRESDVHFVRALYRDEEASKAECIWHCVDGPGTDEHGIRRTLNGMTRAEVEQLKLDFYELSRGRTWLKLPQDMETRLKWETSGDAWHDIERLLKGVPEDVHALHERLMDWHRHERSGPWIRRVDAFTREGEVMDREVAAAHEYYETHIRDKEASVEVRRRFETMVRFCNRDMVGFRMTKNDWSDFVANTSSALAAISSLYPVVYFTSGISPAYLHAAVIALTAGIIQGGVQFFVKLKLKGDGFGREEKLRDISLSAMRACSFYLSKFLPVSMLRRPIDLGTKMGLKTIIRLGETSDVHRTPAHALTLRDLRRALDEEGHGDGGGEADGGLSDHVGKADATCLNSTTDLPFEQSLGRLLRTEK